LAANQKHWIAILNLIRLYEKKDLKEKHKDLIDNYQKELTALLEADKDCIDSLNMGNHYLEDQVIQQSGEVAFEDYMLSAKAGDPEAQCSVATCYLTGMGVEQSHEKAFQFYELAAQQGYAPAQYNLGLFYENEIGTEQL
jgi:uncharacterized protein